MYLQVSNHNKQNYVLIRQSINLQSLNPCLIPKLKDDPSILTLEWGIFIYKQNWHCQYLIWHGRVKSADPIFIFDQAAVKIVITWYIRCPNCAHLPISCSNSDHWPISCCNSDHWRSSYSPVHVINQPTQLCSLTNQLFQFWSLTNQLFQ